LRLESVLLSHCRARPDKLALACGPERVTFGELGRRLRAVAGNLVQAGLRPGDRVVLYLPNCVEFVEAFFAVLAAGGIPIPVTTRLTLREVSYFCDDSSAAMLICHEAQTAGVATEIVPNRPGLKLFAVGTAPEGFVSYSTLREGEPGALPVLPSEQDEAAILYTSGTTGTPKGVVLTHANILIQHGFMNAVEWGISGEDRYLVVAPMAHRSGMGRMINATILGGTLHILGHFDPEAVIDTLDREKITVFGMVPTMCRMLLPVLEAAPERAASIRLMPVTGEAFPVPLKMKLMELMPDMRLTSFFGMTEAGGVTTLAHEEQFSHAGSVGRPSPGVEVRIVDSEGAEVPTGEVGELLVRTGRPGAFTVMKEYLGRPEQTAEALVDGWCHTGDMAKADADGYLYIVDRKKDMVLSGGFNIYSKEVELTIGELPGIRDVAVIGLPDAVFGEAVTAVIEHDPDDKPPTPDEIVAHCRASIAGYKKPKHIFYRTALPRNATGKVMKHALVAELSAELADEAMA